MTLHEKIKLLDQLKEKYYSEKCDLEELRKDFDKLQLSEVDFIHDEKNRQGKLFVCPDSEWEFTKVYEIAEEFLQNAMDVIYDAIVLYYRESDFWDEVTGLISGDLVRIYTNLNNIPIIRFFNTSNVELLNVRKLNFDIR